MAIPLTPKDIIESFQKFGENMIKLDIENAKQNADFSNYPTWYIPFKIRDPKSGDYKPFILKFLFQLFGSHAKLPHGQKKDDAKHLNILFKLMEMEELDKSEYKQRDKLDLLNKNKEFIEALTIISNGYVQQVKNMVKDYEGGKINIPDPVKIHNFMQSERKATEEEVKLNMEKPPNEKFLTKGKIKLEKNFYRIKIPATKQRLLGNLTNSGGGGNNKTFYPVVFDGRTKTKTSPKPNPAKVIINGKPEDLTLDNGPNFLTYLSICGGSINFDSVCISNSGISLMNKFKELHVWPHKKIENTVMEEEDYDEMAQYGTTGYDDNAITDPVPQQNNLPKINSAPIVDPNVQEQFDPEPENNN